MVCLVPVMMLLTGCFTTKIDTAATLHYIRLNDTSCLSRAEKEDLTYNKCLIRKAKYGKFNRVCKVVMNSD